MKGSYINQKAIGKIKTKNVQTILADGEQQKKNIKLLWLKLGLSQNSLKSYTCFVLLFPFLYKSAKIV